MSKWRMMVACAGAPIARGPAVNPMRGLKHHERRHIHRYDSRGAGDPRPSHRRRTCFGRGNDRQTDAIARWHRIGEGACQKGVFEPSVRVRRTPTPTKSAAAIVRSKPAALRILRTEPCPDIERWRGRSSTCTVWQIFAFRRAIFQDISGLTTEYRADSVERLEADALHFT